VTVAAASAAVVIGAASAAGEEDDGKDDQPYPVVIEKIAQTVVHNESSLKDCERRTPGRRRLPFCYQDMWKERKCARLLSKKQGIADFPFQALDESIPVVQQRIGCMHCKMKGRGGTSFIKASLA